MVIEIDFKNKSPISEQITMKMSQLIFLGALKADEKLPSVRNLAIELGINPNTVQKAYNTLEQKKLIYSVVGKGSFVNSEAVNNQSIKKDIIDKIKADIKKAHTFNIEKQEIINVVNEAFEEVGHCD